MKGIINKIALATSLILVDPAIAFGDINVADKRVVIIAAGLDEIIGSSITVADNETDKTQSAVIPLLVPRNMNGFKAHLGVTQEQLKVTEDGDMIAEITDLPPGETMIRTGFRVATTEGKGVLVLKPSVDIPELSVITDERIELHAANLASAVIMDFNNKPHRVWTLLNLKAGESIELGMSGVPAGRARYWLIGGVAGVIMLISNLGFAWRSRPKVDG
jgi:hypothetical protein